MNTERRGFLRGLLAAPIAALTGAGGWGRPAAASAIRGVATPLRAYYAAAPAALMADGWGPEAIRTSLELAQVFEPGDFEINPDIEGVPAQPPCPRVDNPFDSFALTLDPSGVRDADLRL